VSTAVAIGLLVAVVAYAVFGGADFRAGFWDLTAGGSERGQHPRDVCMGAIAGSIASGRVPAGGQAGDPVRSWIKYL
jgi:hypothetical protein